MTFAVCVIILAGIALYVLIANRARKNEERSEMMSTIYKVHGHILKSTMDTKPTTGIGDVGSSVSTNGTYFTHWSYKTYNAKTGFTVHFLENFVTADIREGRKHIDSQPVTTFSSLYKDQEDPFLKYFKKNDLHSLDGTLSYVVDKTGRKYYYSFTPD